MEDENANELESDEVDFEFISEIAKILSEILGSTVAEPIPSTSKKSSEQLLSDVASKNCSESTSESLSPALSLKLQGHALNYIVADVNNSAEDALFETCTVNEMLNEILDCSVTRKPSQLPSTSTEPPLPDSFDAPPEYFLDPREIPRQISQFYIRSDADESTSLRMQTTVNEVLNEVLDYTVFKKSLNSSSCRAMFSDFNRPGPSHRIDYIPQREFLGNREYQIYRSMMGAGLINSSTAVHGETYLQMPATKSLNRILPTYSTVLRLGPPKLKAIYSSPSFIPKVPPPSYAEVEGLWEADGPSLISSESVVFGPDPAYIVCPRCRTVVVTEVETQRSNFTHLMALVMCLCLCWPCCLLPYCLRSCNYTYHTCPNCRYYFGMYRPF